MSRPRRIVLLRHGESEGNIDDTVYEREPDHALSLTATGRKQAEQAGVTLRELFGDERVSAYVSPYRRAHQTFQALGLDPRLVRVREEPRLREQGLGELAGPRRRASPEGVPGRLRPLLLPLRPG
ncbi:hypothetical protein GCM10020000_20730 [Streptomyces olivoverticillatus]